MSALVLRYDRNTGLDDTRDKVFGAILSGSRGDMRANGCGVVAFDGNEAKLWSVGPLEKTGVLGSCASDMEVNMLPALSMYHNREADGFLVKMDVDAPSDIKFTRLQCRGLAQIAVQAYRMVCPDHWSNSDNRAKDPFVVMSMQDKTKETVFFCCPDCRSKTVSGSKNSVITTRCNNSECNREDISISDLVRKVTFKNGFHLHGVQRRNALGTRVDTDQSAPILPTWQHLVVREIIHLLWRAKAESDPTSVPPYSDSESQVIDTNILGSVEGDWNGMMRVDGAPKISSCICADKTLGITECVLCGSSERTGVKRKVVEFGRRYLPVDVLCADGSVHQLETMRVRHFRHFNTTVEDAGTGYVVLKVWDGAIDGVGDVQLSILSVTVDGGIESAIVDPCHNITDGSIVRVRSFRNGQPALLKIVDHRFRDTLHVLQTGCGWLPSSTPLTRFEMPKKFQIQSEDLIDIDKNTPKKNSKRIVGVAIDRSVADDGNAASSRVVLTPEIAQSIVRVQCLVSRRPAHTNKRLTSESTHLRYADDRCAAAKEILLQVWGDRYTERTFLSLRQATADVEKDMGSFAPDPKGKKDTSKSATAGSQMFRKSQCGSQGMKLVRVIYANIEGDGAGKCPNACRCSCGLLRKKYPNHRRICDGDLKGVPVCTQKCCTESIFGRHQSSKQYLLFKISVSRTDVETKVQLRCRSTNVGIEYAKNGTYQYCSYRAHSDKMSSGEEYQGLPFNFIMNERSLERKIDKAVLRRLNPDIYEEMDRKKKMKSNISYGGVNVFVNTSGVSVKPRSGGTIIGSKRKVGKSPVDNNGSSSGSSSGSNSVSNSVSSNSSGSNSVSSGGGRSSSGRSSSVSNSGVSSGSVSSSGNGNSSGSSNGNSVDNDSRGNSFSPLHVVARKTKQRRKMIGGNRRKR